MTDVPEPLDADTWRIFGGLHRLLLRLAGRIPDDLLAHARHMVGAGDLAYLPDTLTVPAARFGVSMPAADLALLREIVRVFGGGGEPQLVDEVPTSEAVPPTGHRFDPASPEVMAAAGGRIPARLDLAGGGPAALADLADDLVDTKDQLTIGHLAEQPGAARAWRAWRSGPDATSPARRVYVVEMAPGTSAWDVAYEAADLLGVLGEDAPQVEVYWADEAPPPYQQAARDRGALLWTAAAQPAGGAAAQSADGAREAIDRAIGMARSGDLQALRDLIDWPLTGAPGMASALNHLAEAERAGALSSGLANMDAAPDRPEIVQRVLGPVLDWLPGAREIRPADPEDRAGVLRMLRIPDAPGGLTDDQVARLARLRERAAALTDVYMVAGPAGELPIAWAPDSRRLVLVFT
ncbi:MAG: hypothetical protein V7603_3600 [Micromonosporaceae bacterium]